MERRVFSRIGKFISKRKYFIILAWIIVLAVLSPNVLKANNVVSLSQESSSSSSLESVKAANIITAQFKTAVPNSTLIIVVSTSNATALQTQQFLSQIITQVLRNSSITGLENAVSVYSLLNPVLNSTNQAAYQTLNQANATVNLLYGVAAEYLTLWSNALNQTQNVQQANQIAYNQTAASLSSANQTSFNLYSSKVLDLFYAAWNQSFQNPQTQNYTALERASAASSQANQKYVAEYTAGDEKAFATALIQSFSLQEFLSASPEQFALKLQDFSVSYFSNFSGLSTGIINATMSLGRTFDFTALETLAGNIVWNPAAYAVEPQLESMISQLVSPSKNITLITLSFSNFSDSDLLTIRSIIRANLPEGSSGTIQSALVTGSDALNYDSSQSTQQDLGIILPITIVLLLVSTGLFFQSVVTPFITLSTIGIALAISQTFILLVGTYVGKVDFTIPSILVAVLVGVGTDYSIFVMARHREEQIYGLPVHEAITKAVTWAGESIATSGATVIIAFAALSLATIIYLRTLGLIVGAGVLVALIAALTFVPAIVTVLGSRAFWPNSGKRFERYSSSVITKLKQRSGYFSKSSAFSVKRANVIILLAVLVTVPAAYIYFSTELSYNFLSGSPSNIESVTASNLLISAFGGGKLFPTYVVVTFSEPLVIDNNFTSSEMNLTQQISTFLSEQEDVLQVKSPTMPFGLSVSYSNLNLALEKDNSTFQAILQNISSDNKTALIIVTFKIDPYSKQAIAEAEKMRTSIHDRFGNAQGVTAIYLGGASGSVLDSKNQLQSQFNILLPIVLVAIGVVLFLVLKSLFLPVFAVVSILMSIVWTLAVTAIVFQTAFNYGLFYITPVFLIITLLGLGMDYNIFILTRIREETGREKQVTKAVVRGIERTGAIITAAAIILAGSLGALMLSSDLLLKEIGFALSFSILVDALVVRTYLVPAVMSTLGKWNWYDPLSFIRKSKVKVKAESSTAAE